MIALTSRYPSPLLATMISTPRQEKFKGEEHKVQKTPLEEIRHSLAENKIVSRNLLARYYPELKQELSKPLTQYDTPEIIRERNRVLALLHDAWLQGGEKVDPVFCQQLTEQMYDENIYKKDKEAFILLGHSGAGKSTVAVPLAQKHTALLIEGDNIRDNIPLFHETQCEHLVTKTRKKIANMLLKRAVQSGDNVIMSAMPKKIADVEQMLGLLEQYDYKINLIYVSLPGEVAVQRTMERYNTQKRLSDPYCEKRIVNSYLTIYNALKSEQAIDTFTILDNDVPEGHEPVVIEEGRFTRPFKKRRQYQPRTIAFG